MTKKAGYQWKPIQPLSDEILREYASWSEEQKKWLEKYRVLKEKDPKKFADFINEAERDYLIHSFKLERLYKFSTDEEEDRGITETLIKGMQVEAVERLPQEEQVNLKSVIFGNRLSEFMKDYFSKDLEKHFIRGLHVILMEGIEHYETVNSLGQRQRQNLKPGQWKVYPNNPSRPDGVLHEYCPADHVESEIESLLSQINRYLKLSDQKRLNPLVAAAFAHHRFTQIHPFPDGNGRVARALMNFFLVKFKLLPIAIRIEDKEEYLTALEMADAENDLSPLIQLLERLESIRVENAIDRLKAGRVSGAEDFEIRDLVEMQNRKEEDDAAKRSDALIRLRDIVIGLCKEKLESWGKQFEQSRKVTGSSVHEGKPKESQPYWADIIHGVKRLPVGNRYYVRKSDENRFLSLRFFTIGNYLLDFVLSFHEVGYGEKMAILPFSQIRRPEESNTPPEVDFYLNQKPFFFTPETPEAKLRREVEIFLEEHCKKGALYHFHNFIINNV